jgi:hypothetical protein
MPSVRFSRALSSASTPSNNAARTERRHDQISTELARGYAAVALGIAVVSLFSGLGALVALRPLHDSGFRAVPLADFARISIRLP